MKLYLSTCQKWANDYPDSMYRDLVLTGSTGLGKTFLLHAMAERLIEKDVNVLIISAYRMLDILRRSYFDNDQGSSDLIEAEVLMIDDLGSEPMLNNISKEYLYVLLNERMGRKLKTVIATNLTQPQIKELYQERIMSRLSDKAYWDRLLLQGKDLRRA